jgi:hypothetical protein
MLALLNVAVTSVGLLVTKKPRPFKEEASTLPPFVVTEVILAGENEPVGEMPATGQKSIHTHTRSTGVNVPPLHETWNVTVL